MGEVIKHYGTQHNTVTIVGTEYKTNFRYLSDLVETAKDDFPQLKEENIYVCIMADHPLYHDHVGINFRVGPAWVLMMIMKCQESFYHTLNRSEL